MSSREPTVGDELEGTCSGWYGVGRGYGFIASRGIDKDIFVPARNLLNAMNLEVGDRVRFEVRLGTDGKLMADHVEALDGEHA